MRNKIKAIETTYKGVKFRSKMEANFAKWCDENKQKWIYEPEGLTNGKDCYLPDFYLPDSKMIVEIKPVFFIEEAYKLDMILNCKEFDGFGLAVIEMTPGPHVIKYSPPEKDDTGEEGNQGRFWSTAIELDTRHDAGIQGAGFCNKCNAFNINSNQGSWACLSCGHYDGDQTIAYLNNH